MLKISEMQLGLIRECQKEWPLRGVTYEDIILKDDIVYLTMGNGAAFSITRQGECEWVAKGWYGGESIIERPSGKLLVSVIK